MSLTNVRSAPIYLYAKGPEWVIERAGKCEFYPDRAKAMARGMELGGTGGWTRELKGEQLVLVAIPKSEE